MFVSPSSLPSGTGDVSLRGLLISRPLSVSSPARRPAQCLRLAYHLGGVGCSLVVKVLSVDYSLSSRWSRDCDPSDGSWNELELSLGENKPFQVSHCSLTSWLLSAFFPVPLTHWRCSLAAVYKFTFYLLTYLSSFSALVLIGGQEGQF